MSSKFNPRVRVSDVATLSRMGQSEFRRADDSRSTDDTFRDAFILAGPTQTELQSVKYGELPRDDVVKGDMQRFFRKLMKSSL